MKKLSFFLMAMLFSVMSFAAETVAYTLTPAATGGNSSPHNAYASAADWTYEGITWNVTGNSYMVPWRIGGKSITAQDRAVYTKTAMAADITKIEITHATVNITCNSCTLTISDAANGDGETFPVKVTQNTTTTITLPEGDYSNKFYKLVYNVTNTTTSNKYVQLSEIKFYTEVQTSVEAPTFTPEEGKVAANNTFAEPFALTIASATTDATIKYTLDGTDPTLETALTYEAPITISTMVQVRAIAVKGEEKSVESSVAYIISSSEAKPYTASEAIAAEALGLTGTVYVTGTVKSIEELSTEYGNATYNITDGTKELKIYRGKNLENAKFTSADQLLVGDVVVVKGDLTSYNGAAQLGQNNYLISRITYMVIEDEITNFVFDMEAWPMVCYGGPSAGYGVEVNLVLADAEGTLSYEDCSVSIQGTEATFIDGTLSNIDPFAPSADAVLRVQWNGDFYELHLAMSAAAAEIEATVIEIDNATVTIEERSMGFGDEVYHVLKMESTWSDGETTYPVLLETTEFDQTKESQEVTATITVGGMGDEDPWLGSAEGDVTITVANGVVTVEGLLENAYAWPAPIAFDVTISGKLPVEEPAGLTYNVTVPEGTYACYIAGEMNGWGNTEMTEMTKVDDTHYTITIEGATTAMKYKYCSGPDWKYVEKDANGNEIVDRTYAENDVVASWAAIYNPNPTEPEPETKDITVKAKVPAAWTDQITAWVWYTGENGKEVIAAQEGDWYVVTETCAELKIIFKNGAGWNGDANQTVDMTFAESTCIELTAGEGKATYTAVDCESDIEPETTWTVAGSSTAVFGTAWDPANVANDMTLQNDGTYKWEKKELLFAAGDPIEFKVVKNHAWGEEYPMANYVLTIAEDGIYTVTITFNPSTKEVVAVDTKTGDAEVEVEISYVLMGVQNDWETGIALTRNEDNTETEEYMLLGQEILEGDAVKVVTLRNGEKSTHCGNVDETSPVAYGFDADGNIVLKPGKYDFYYKVAENIIYIGGEAYPEAEVIAYELNGGVLPAPAVPTQEELWASFKTAAGLTTLGTLVEITEAGAGKPHNNPDNPCACRIICAKLLDANVNAVFALPEWAWLKAYIMTVQSGLPEASNVSWRYAFAAFFLQSEHSAYPASADFTEAGKPEAWGAAYQAANELVLPTEPVAEDYVLPTPTKEGYIFVGWYDNAEGAGEAYKVIPAGWAGTLYAIWTPDAITALENIAVEGKAVKAIINGQLIIIKNGVQYNAQGQVVK